MPLEPALDWQLFKMIIISLGIGGIVGLERQSHHDPDSGLGGMGMRTFALSALLGTLSVVAQDVIPALPYITGLGYVMLLLAFFWLERHRMAHGVGITTQVSALLVFVLGAMTPDFPLFSASVAVIVASILSVKRVTHRMVNLLTTEEILSTMKLLLVTVVLLPQLPKQPVDPWGIYNPREIWLLVVLINGIGFLAYFAIRFLGTGRGLILTGILGGMASSTAVTLAMSRQVKKVPDSPKMLISAALAIFIANSFMFVRVTTTVGLVNADLLKTLWIPFLIMSIPGIFVVGFTWYRLRKNFPSTPVDSDKDVPDEESDEENQLELENPFELVPAIKLTLIFIVIIGVASVLQRTYGDSAIYVTSFFGGIAENNAISLTLARMASSGALSDTLATQGIIVAILSNSVVKTGLTLFVGTKKLASYVALGLLPVLIAGILSIFIL